ncbi:MAG: hypothetical protein P4L33_15520 [Capsulimonadaceae bacterium]|nr:hypothetical protein [Capsulimonadaceae bacterium]
MSFRFFRNSSLCAKSLALAAWLFMCVPHAVAGGLVPNPGFDADASGVASGWNVNAAMAHGKNAWVSLSVKPVNGEAGNVTANLAPGSHNTNGANCLHIQGDMRSGKDFILVSSGLIRVEPGFAYTVNAWYKAKGLVPENGDRTQSVQTYFDIFQIDADKKFVASSRAITCVNTPAWAPLATQPFTILNNVKYVAIRLCAASTVPGEHFDICYADVSLTPQDASLPNAGFETLDPTGLPVAWRPRGTGRELVDGVVRHGGKYCVSVSDTGNGPLSGWTTEMPARDDRTYRLAGWAKGGALASNGYLPGGALQIEFVDRDDRVLAAPAVSSSVSADQDWTELITPVVKTPPGTVRIRLTVGTQFCNGTAWFDDLRLDTKPVASCMNAVMLTRNPKPDPECKYSTNLLRNGDVEEGDGGKPAHWTFVGSSARDWTGDAIAEFHTRGRPPYSVGRASGEWSHDAVYSGRGSLLLESIDPPLSTNRQWYGRNPVNGYWLSDSMPCTSGDSYMAAAWVCPGATIHEEWFGPLELQFFDSAGHAIQSNEPRSGMGDVPAAVWTWWTTRPYRAPAGAATMRLRVGQELSAVSGGWGRSFYDNLAVWRLAFVFDPPSAVGRTALHRAWLRKQLAVSPPPYLPSPAAAAEYETCLTSVENAVAGNCFHDPGSPVKLRVNIANLLGEARTVSLHAECFDWKGNALPSSSFTGITLHGYGVTDVTLKIPATHAYGAFYVDLTVKEGDATAGSGSGRFAELPALDRPRTHEPIWGITPLMDDMVGDQWPRQKEVGDLFHIAGFGVSWVRLYTDSIDPVTIGADTAKLRPLLKWYNSLGIRPVLQIMAPLKRPFDHDAYVKAGTAIAKESSDLVLAYGNHGIEISNTHSPWRGATGSMTDEEYDLIMCALYEGLKSVAPNTPVLVGNIATDWQGKTLTRLYGSPVSGAFDGAILNAYMGVTMTVVNSIKTLDAHGDTKKGVWQEETALQGSPCSGEARRYGEGGGASNLVRGWLEPVIKSGDRLKSFTQWFFRAGGDNAGSDNNAMVNSNLQPRPQFVAHAVMADALADATLVADRSNGLLTCGEWKRGDGPLLVMWTPGGDQAVALEAPAGKVTVMDVMGNRRTVLAKDGVAIVNAGFDPVYCFGGGAIAFSKRLEVSLTHGDHLVDRPMAALTVRNNENTPETVKFSVRGPVTGPIPDTLTVPGHAQRVVEIPVDTTGLDHGKRTQFSAAVTMKSGAMFVGSASLNFAYAVRAAIPVPMTGKWDGPWALAPVIEFGRNPDEVVKPTAPGENYDGPDSILGKFRMLWDDHCLYLGVEALDAIYCPVFGTQNGFMGDSIELALQPDGILSNLAPRYEYEFFRPAGATTPVVNRRFPSDRAGAVTGWSASVTPTGHRGDVNYQLAIPWTELRLASSPSAGKVITLGLVLNNVNKNPVSPYRGRLLWFRGVDAKNTSEFGDVVLVETCAAGANVRP